MPPTPLTESSQHVTIPNLGPMIRIERRDADCELVEVEYRRPSLPNV